MAGIIGAALAGAAEGIGFGAASVGKQMLGHAFEKEKQAILEQRELNLANLNNAAADRRLGASLDHAERLHTQTDTRIREEGKATRQLQSDLAQSQERSANTRHGQSISIQMAQLKAVQDQVQLIPQADGTFQRVRKDGTSMGTLTDLSGNPVIGPKDVSASAKILVEGNNKIITALAKDAGEAIDPAAKKGIMDQIDQLKQENQRLLGVATSTPGPGAQPSAGDIAGLRSRASNPAAVAAFEARYGQGSAAQYVGDQQTRQPGTGPAGGPDSAAQLPKLVTTPQAQISPKEKHAQARAEQIARNDAASRQRLADTFRSVLQTGRYTPDDAWLIEQASKLGELTPKERALAGQMLDAIAETDFRAGFAGGQQ